MAGCADDPSFAEAELLGDYLTKSLPRIGFTTDMRQACEWPEFRRKLTQLHGFACPGSSTVVWRRDGRLVGGTGDFKRVLKDMYDLELELDEDVIAAITAENAHNAATAAESDEWTPYIGHATKMWQDGISFTGTWTDHQPIKGVVTFRDGATYTGALKNGKFHGHGKRQFPNGAKFVGTHAEGRREGMGKYTDPQGNVYDGLYSRGICHGKGRRAWASPVTSGQFGNDVLEQSSGREFVGDWTQSSASGHGTETIPIKVLVTPPDLDQRPPWVDPNRPQSDTWHGRYRDSKPTYMGSMRGVYVNKQSFQGVRGVAHPKEDGVVIFAVDDGSGGTKLVGANTNTLGSSVPPATKEAASRGESTMSGDHHRIAKGLIDLKNDAAVIAAYDSAEIGPFQGQQHTISNVRKVDGPWKPLELPRLARNVESLTALGNDSVGLFEIQGLIQSDSVEFTKSYRKNAYDRDRFSAVYGVGILEEYATTVSVAISAGVIQEAAAVEAPAFTTSQDGLLSAGGINKFAKWVVDLSVDDFDISSRFKVEQIAGTAVSFDLWSGVDQTRIGLDGAGNSLFREGDSWGEEATMDSGLDRTPLKENCIHTLRLVRTAGRLAVFFDEVPIPGWQNLRLENSITAIGWRPWRNKVDIQTLEAHTKLSIRFEGAVKDGQLSGVYTLPVEYGGGEGNFELIVGRGLDPEPGCFIKGALTTRNCCR